MMIDAPAIWLPPAPAVIRPATADLLLLPAYWPTDLRERGLAFREFRDTGRVSADQIREAVAIWRVREAIPYFAPVFFAGAAPRSFSISPAVFEKTTWDLDVDGPLILLDAGTYVIRPRTSKWSATVDLNGGGAAGAHRT
jgi:hypothetical protein